MRRRMTRIFMANTGKVGMGLGITSLLGRWLTGNTHVTSTDILVRYGLAGSLGYMVAGALGLILFSWIAKRIRSEVPEGGSLGGYLHSKLGSRAAAMMSGIFILLTMQPLLIQGMTAALLMKAGFGVPFMAGCMVFILLSLLLLCTGGDAWVQNLSLVTVFLMFVTVILLPLYFFIKHGVETVYSGIRLYHTYMLVLDNEESYLFMLTGVLVSFAQICCDPATWQRVFTIERKKVLTTFIISGIVWITVEFALILLVGIALHTGGFINDYSLIQHLMVQIGTPILLFLLYACLIGNAMTSFSAAFSGGVQLIVMLRVNRKTGGERRGVQCWVLPLFMTAVLAVLLGRTAAPSILDLILAFGLLSAVFFVPVLYVVFVRNPNSRLIVLVSGLGLAVGGYTYERMDPLTGVWIGAAMTALLFAFCIGIQEVYKRRWS